MKSFFEDNVAIEAIVKEIIPAGFMLDIEIDGILIDAFMPNTLADVNKLHDVNVLVGEKILVMLETLQQDKGIYVVSRKRYLKTLIPEKIKNLKNYPKDHVFTGFVTGTRDFGIFVQFEECLTGMIHKANVNQAFREKLSEIQPGTPIDFYVKDVIKGGSQIIATQTLEESLWDTVRVGDKLEGSIITVKPFGALIALDYETNGLIQTTYINKNNKVLKPDDKVNVIVISIIRDDRKIYLTFADDEEMVDKLKEKSTEIDKLKQKFNSKD
jgi:ribosomal protein S1